MADTTPHTGVAGTQSSNSSEAPNHLNTNIETGGFDNEKSQDAGAAVGKKPAEDDEEDEDMDALIDELESQDGHVEEEEEENEGPGQGRVIPEDQLQTDTRVGLTESEVTARRKKYGLNQMKEEKENLILKFLGFFIGPIQFVMEVSWNPLASTRPVCPSLSLPLALFLGALGSFPLLIPSIFPPPIALRASALAIGSLSITNSLALALTFSSLSHDLRFPLSVMPSISGCNCGSR
jgi:hypothetical protein